jgi:RecA/RadA recombinase
VKRTETLDDFLGRFEGETEALAAVRALLSAEHALELDRAPALLTDRIAELIVDGTATAAQAAEAFAVALALYASALPERLGCEHMTALAERHNGQRKPE